MSAAAARPSARADPSSVSIREPPHEPPGRPGHRRLGREEPRHRRDRVPRGRRGHHRLRRRPPARRRQDQLDHRAAGPGPPRHRRRRPVLEAAVREGRRQRRHRRALRRQQQLVRRLRLLAVQALRARRRQAARRRAQEVGAGRPHADHRGRRRARPPATPRRTRTWPSAPSGTRWWPRSGPRTWSTCARPTSSPARSWPRRTCRRSSRSGPGHVPSAINIPWSKAANEDGTFRSDEELDQALRRGRPGRGQGHHRLLPDRRAQLAHLGGAARAARATPT